MKPREPRHKVLIPARICKNGEWADITIRDISPRGLLVQTRASLPRGTYVEIRRANHIIVGRIVWTKDQRSGVYAQDRLDVGAIIKGPAPPSSPTAIGKPLAERRAVPDRSRIGVAERLERSRRWSSAFEFACIVAAGAAAAGFAASVVNAKLGQALQTASNQLG